VEGNITIRLGFNAEPSGIGSRWQADPLISDRIPREDLASRGLHHMEAQAADTLKILVKP
jgi:hypothetical protein